MMHQLQLRRQWLHRMTSSIRIATLAPQWIHRYNLHLKKSAVFTIVNDHALLLCFRRNSCRLAIFPDGSNPEAIGRSRSGSDSSYVARAVVRLSAKKRGANADRLLNDRPAPRDYAPAASSTFIPPDTRMRGQSGYQR